MTPETMTPAERVWAAIRLEKPDRVPIVPTMTPESDGGLLGLSLAYVQSRNDIALDASLRVFDAYGGWDGVMAFPYTPRHRHAIQINPMRICVPGRDLPEDYMAQLVEEEVMKLEDYEKICEVGFERFYYEDYLSRISDLVPQELPRVLDECQATTKQLDAELAKRGVESFIGAIGGHHPFFMLSQIRSLLSFTEDLYYKPELVEKTLEKMTDEMISTRVELARSVGARAANFVDERGSAFYYPPAVFERFWWPYFQRLIDACWSEGIVSIWHLDTCWEKNLPYFRQIPRGSAVLQFDGTTDLLLAKEVLRDHLCLYGDVPAALLTIGSRAEVEAYCRKLIDAVGEGGGFILGSGCCVPPNCKPENFQAMLETGKQYELS